MPHYFIVYDADRFTRLIGPALAESARRQSFESIRELAAAISGDIETYCAKYLVGTDELLLHHALPRLAYDRHLWSALAGELFLVAAAAIPELQTAPETVAQLVSPGSNCFVGRIFNPSWIEHGRIENRSYIDQVHFGSRDLRMGPRIYRPGLAGWNDAADVARLAAYLTGIDPASWSPDQLAGQPNLDPTDWAEELAFAQEWFPPLRDLYIQAAEQSQIIICEDI